MDVQEPEVLSNLKGPLCEGPLTRSFLGRGLGRLGQAHTQPFGGIPGSLLGESRRGSHCLVELPLYTLIGLALLGLNVSRELVPAIAPRLFHGCV